MAKRLRDEEIVDLLNADIDTAKTYQEQLSAERARLYGVYRCVKYGNEVKKWSQSVHPTAYNAVEWLKPGLFEVFTGDFFNIRAKRQRGETQEQIKAADEAAKRLKGYIRFKLFDQMDGEQLVEDLIHDCLVSHYGVVKVCHRDEYDVVTERAPRISDQEIAALEGDNTVTEIRGGESATEIDPVLGLPVWSGLVNATIVRKKRIYNGFHISVIPPWELYFLPGYDTLEACPFVAHRVRRSLDHIKRQELAGVYKKGTYEKVKDRVDERLEHAETMGETQQLHTVDGLGSPDEIRSHTSSAKEALSSNEAWVWECYRKLDLEGDGILEPYIVTICEDVVMHEPIKNPYGSAPFELGYVLKEPHKIVGRPLPAVLEDRQKVMSNLLRNIQDSAARSTYGGWLTSNHQAKLLLQRMGPGDVAWAPDINAIKEIAPSAPSQYIFEAYNLTKAEIAAESGVNENMQGLDDNALNKTAAGMNMRLTAGMQKQKLYARRMARCWKRVLRRVMDIMRRWPPEDDVESVGADIALQPDDLRGQYSVDIEVGVGSQDRQNQAQMLDQLVMFGVQAGLPSGMMTKEQIVAAQKARFEYMDMDVSEFLQSPEAMAGVEGQQSQMQQAGQQMQQMQAQLEQAGKDFQGMQQEIMRLERENQALKAAPPEDRTLEIAQFQLDAEVEREKLALEREKLALERAKLEIEAQKVAIDARLKVESAADAREMAVIKQSQPQKDTRSGK